MSRMFRVFDRQPYDYYKEMPLTIKSDHSRGQQYSTLIVQFKHNNNNRACHDVTQSELSKSLGD